MCNSITMREIKMLKRKMGLCNIPDNFQEKMNELFNGLEYIRAYNDDQLIIGNGNFVQVKTF